MDLDELTKDETTNSCFALLVPLIQTEARLEAPRSILDSTAMDTSGDCEMEPEVGVSMDWENVEFVGKNKLEMFFLDKC